MTLFLLGMGIMTLGGAVALLADRAGKSAAVPGVVGAVAGCALALVPAFRALLDSPAETLRLPWGMPSGSFFVEIDALSGFFLVPILLVSGLAAVYGGEYLNAFRGKKPLGAAWFWFNLLIAGMAMVVVARNGLLFLVAWETMALSSFFLVTFENERAEVREAGWTYMIATHLGTAFLLAMFLLLGRDSGSLDFDTFGKAAPPATAFAGLIFILAVIGFGTKAGFMPMHVWLPEAHPAAPSHVSAVMSGVMIKTGIYGLVRVFTFLGPPLPWWGWVLIGIGVTSGILGVLFALAQHDLKRLLAYHSVENIGIIVLGLGLGMLGMSWNRPELAVLGFGGGLLHVLNHAMFKGLLFLGAGAVLHGAKTREIDHLGGLLKRMPWTGTTFLIGAAAISGLPPLNGFVSEFLITFGAFRQAADVANPAATVVPAVAAIGALALIGGLAAACFAKAFGIVFLGEPRTERADHAHEAGPAMRLPMAALAAGCVLVGLFPSPVVTALAPALETITGRPGTGLDEVGSVLWRVTAVTAALLGAVALAALLRAKLLAGRKVEETVTWDCGYARPTARMQYTASSFAQPIVALFRMFLRTHSKTRDPEGLFPSGAALETHTSDVAQESLFRPAFEAVGNVLGRVRVLQHGRVQLYVLTVVLTLVVLLVWKLR